ncbi:acyl-CoA dehydrogenase [Halieaceae bacterium IMCC14734]|uniref:Acyl-CoA dehydrogenase n=1 Tax=Candidatus Litorirhabdus singularis TaxID=2518993 RepID=A0ABT3TCX7_9GAMM|nr:acyl-CoA dehydrogenase family protein [Candidatus Litorirhabdus singularis]MCX2980153.1 acyl-CoA dehydrogenase [Candidatus Litorirhabdus singularis]
MDLEFSPEDLAFQAEVRRFLDESFPPHLKRITARTPTVFVDAPPAMEWQKILVDKGWAVPGWPEEWGGTTWSATQKYVFSMECARAGTPGYNPLSLALLAPVLMAFGTEEQKQEYLPKMLTGEHYWCQGFSEPGSGSDLASLKLKAERQGDNYLVNGSKLWQTHAQYANHIFCLVRTDNSGRKQQGISFLLIEMDRPGVTVEPIITMGMDHEVNQVFFEDVEVPVSNLVGAEGEGWKLTKYLLEHERGGGSTAHRRLAELDHVKAIIAEMEAEDPSFNADKTFSKVVGRIEIDIKALEMTELRILSAMAEGKMPGAESSILKLTSVNIEQRTHELAVDVLGYDALPFKQDDIGPDYAAPVVPTYLNSRAASIFGGSQEVQRNIIAKGVLGL